MRVLSIILLFMMVPVSAIAEERIRGYHSDIHIDENGEMHVTETITVNAEGNKIKRGIYRDFPTRYKDRFGNKYNVGFSITGVERDGRREDYHTSNLSNGIRIYIGSKDRYLKSGTYTYMISYETNRQLGFFENHDELYWNVTGTDWDFPIDQATAEVFLPENIPRGALGLEGYTGSFGSRAVDYTANITAEGSAYFETTRTLPRRHGLTIVVTWPKGYIPEPTRSEKIDYLLQDNRYLMFAMTGLAILFIYYFITWSRVGKDPEKGVIIPHYQPPRGHSPASMRFVKNMGYDNTCFTAAIINLAVKGYLKIEEDDDGDYSLIRTKKDDIVMAAGESTLAKHLFGKNSVLELIAKTPILNKFINKLGYELIEKESTYNIDKIKLTNANHSRIGGALAAHQTSLENDYEKIYFLNNQGWFIVGLVLPFLLLGVTFYNHPAASNPEIIPIIVWLGIWTIVSIFLVKLVYHVWSNIHGIASVLGALGMTLFATPFLAGEIFGLFAMAGMTSWSTVFIIIIIVIINWVFYELLKAPTLAGRKLLDQIEGFKQYIDLAEKHELDFKHPRGRCPELFEEYLPYALALGIEQQWGQQFAGVLASAQTPESNAYSPSWYRGSHWNISDIGDFTGSLGSTFTSAIASSSTAPGSSSGSGGGGFSGGGGGGGGGGGW